MERNDIKIDIAEILKDKPKGTKLYCKLIGDCNFDSVSPDGTIQVYNDRNDYVKLDRYGRFNQLGEVLLYPSEDMIDWNLFKVTKNAYNTFDYVLVKCDDDPDVQEWTLFQYSHTDSYGNIVFVGGGYADAENVIPYEGNESLLGTQI